MTSIEITEQVLREIGITCNQRRMKELLIMFNNELSERITVEMFDSLSVEQADELVQMTREGAPDAAIADWIAVHVPDVAAIVQEEFHILMGDIAANVQAYW